MLTQEWKLYVTLTLTHTNGTVCVEQGFLLVRMWDQFSLSEMEGFWGQRGNLIQPVWLTDTHTHGTLSFCHDSMLFDSSAPPHHPSTPLSHSCCCYKTTGTRLFCFCKRKKTRSNSYLQMPIHVLKFVWAFVLKWCHVTKDARLSSKVAN